MTSRDIPGAISVPITHDRITRHPLGDDPMNDTPDLFDELDGFEPTTIRPATPSDSRALDRLAELDDTDLGECPHLVGEVAAKSSLRSRSGTERS